MKIVFDLDGTLCTTASDGNYANALPIHSRISKVNELYEAGNHITIFTARGMGRSQDNELEARNMFELLTKAQLDQWGIKYHRLILGKPSADIYVDDKGVKDVDFFKS